MGGWWWWGGGRLVTVGWKDLNLLSSVRRVVWFLLTSLPHHTTSLSGLSMLPAAHGFLELFSLYGVVSEPNSGEVRQ